MNPEDIFAIINAGMAEIQRGLLLLNGNSTQQITIQQIIRDQLNHIREEDLGDLRRLYEDTGNK